MSEIKPVNIEEIRSKLPEFEEKTREFYDKKLNIKEYKGFSGKYGSYAQRGGKANMLRLRMNAGVLTKDKMRFIVEEAEKHDVPLLHLTTCQTVQMHDLQPDALFEIMDHALDHGIIWYGGGGDYPRNVMCAPLSGVDHEEYFDVMPYALAASEFLIQFIDEDKMPRKLKVGFAGSDRNSTHATFRDLGFLAREDGTFDVYICGGLGQGSKFGVLAQTHVDPLKILYYVEGMIRLFRKYGNYENRTKARTRFLQEVFPDHEALRKAYLDEVHHVMDEERITLDPLMLEKERISKEGDGTVLEENWRLIRQKQDGLYAVRFHPLGGSLDKTQMRALYELIKDMDQVEIRLAPDETAFIINLNGDEARRVLKLTEDWSARNPFESSISCIGASICQVGLRNSPAMLAKCIREVRKAGISDAALPQMHISGCPSSCGTHQVGEIGWRGGVRLNHEKKPMPAFILYLGGREEVNGERMGEELGAVLEDDVPRLLVDFGRAADEAGMSFTELYKTRPEYVKEIAGKYL